MNPSRGSAASAAVEDTEDLESLDNKAILTLVLKHTRDLSRRIGMSEQRLQQSHTLELHAVEKTMKSMMQEIRQKIVKQDSQFAKMESDIQSLMSQVDSNHEDLSMLAHELNENLLQELRSDLFDVAKPTMGDYGNMNVGAFRREMQEHMMETKITQRKVHNDIRSIRNMLKSPGSYFFHFMDLPSELRMSIWQLAIPKRLFCCDRSREHLGTDFRLSVPAIAQVCRESRQVALSLGRMCSLYPEPVQNPWSFFTPDRDIVLVRKYHEHLDFMPQDVEQVALEPVGYRGNIPASSDDIVSSLSDLDLGNPVQFPRLRTISVLMYQPTIIDQKWHASHVSELLRGDSVVVIDVENPLPVPLSAYPNTERAHDSFVSACFASEPGKIGRSGLGNSTDLVQRHINFSYLQGSAFGPDGNLETWDTTQVWSEVKNRLFARYLRQRYDWTPLTVQSDDLLNADMSANLEIPWVKEQSKILQIRPVHIFALLDGHPSLGQFRRFGWESGE